MLHIVLNCTPAFVDMCLADALVMVMVSFSVYYSLIFVWLRAV